MHAFDTQLSFDSGPIGPESKDSSHDEVEVLAAMPPITPLAQLGSR